MTRQRLKIVALLATCGLLVLAGALYVALWDVPSVKIAATRYPAIRYSGSNNPPTIRWTRTRPTGWVSLEEIPKHVSGAVIVSEDWGFYQHRGFDFRQIREAIKVDFKARRFVRGASTITQQVARNLFLEKDKTLWRKLKELVLTIALERSCSKDRILELYFNIAEWGRGIYGIGPASQHYFKKGVWELSPKEAAFLAMLLPSPRRYSISYEQGRLSPKAERTVEDILKKMVQAGYLEE